VLRRGDRDGQQGVFCRPSFLTDAVRSLVASGLDPGNPYPSPEAFMPRSVFFLLLAALLLGVAPPATAQLYLRLAGETQGPIDGDVDLGPLTGTIATTSFQVGFSVPIDPSTGLPSGPSQTSELSITKQTDVATIPILRAFGNAERMTTCFLEAFRPDDVGGSQLYLRITLTDARITSWSVSGAADGARAVEALSLTYTGFEWRDFDTGEVYTDTGGASSVLPDALAENVAVASMPNPTSGATDFRFRVPEQGSVAIDVFDFRGRHVVTVFEGETRGSEGSISWDGRDSVGRPVASGVYLVKMRSGAWLTTHKMSVMR